jgi:hypothetical protein
MAAHENFRPIQDALLALSKRRTAHPITRYIYALAGTQWLVTIVAVGGESLVFRLANGNILHITSLILTPELGSRFFDLPMLTRGVIPTPGDVNVFYFVQPEALTPVSECEMLAFAREIEKSGWLFADPNQHQLGFYQGEIKLLDPFAVVPRPFQNC